MIITRAIYRQYEGVNSCIEATIDGIDYMVPLSDTNTHYLEIMRQVEAGELTIADAE